MPVPNKIPMTTKEIRSRTLKPRQNLVEEFVFGGALLPYSSSSANSSESSKSAGSYSGSVPIEKARFTMAPIKRSAAEERRRPEERRRRLLPEAEDLRRPAGVSGVSSVRTCSRATVPEAVGVSEVLEGLVAEESSCILRKVMLYRRVLCRKVEIVEGRYGVQKAR